MSSPSRPSSPVDDPEPYGASPRSERGHERPSPAGFNLSARTRFIADPELISSVGPSTPAAIHSASPEPSPNLTPAPTHGNTQHGFFSHVHVPRMRPLAALSRTSSQAAPSQPATPARETPPTPCEVDGDQLLSQVPSFEVAEQGFLSGVVPLESAPPNYE